MPYLWMRFIDDVFFLPSSSHPSHISANIPYSLAYTGSKGLSQLTWRRTLNLLTRSLDAAFDKFRLLSRSENLVKVPCPHEVTEEVSKDTYNEKKLQLHFCDSNIIKINH